MPPYLLSGWKVASEVALDDHAPVIRDEREADLVVCLEAPAVRPAFAADTVASSVDVGGRAFLTVARRDDGWVLRIHDTADFLIDAAAHTVRCVPLPGAAAEDLARAVVDRVIPHVLSQRGIPAVHASSVDLAETGAIAFVGNPGSGKSTLAAAFKPPATLVCDDCAALSLDRGGALVHRSYGFVRLREDSASFLATESAALGRSSQQTRKWRVSRQGGDDPRPLLAIYALELEPQQNRAEVGIARLSQRDALTEMARHLFRLDPTDRSRLEQELDMLTTLVELVPVSRLHVPRAYGRLPAVTQAVIDDVARRLSG